MLTRGLRTRSAPGGAASWSVAPPTRRTRALAALPLLSLSLTLGACDAIMRQTDRDVAQMIRERQRKTLEREASADLHEQNYDVRPDQQAYRRRATATVDAVPPDFLATTRPTTAPATNPNGVSIAARYPMPTYTGPTRRTREFHLTDALGYAQQHRRPYQTAKERLYRAALDLTLERHLWTPIFAQQLQTVYGNYGEDQQFDQAMRFVNDASVSQRLPYGGELTARMLNTLIRDVKKTLTAEESGRIEVGLRVPLLREAGMVAQETLIQLERELTYSVRVFERFRREQVADIAQNYFGLLRAKQDIVDTEFRYRNAVDDFARARALEETGRGTILDTQRAEQAMLSAENTLEVARESFRNQADEFKLFIGMPIEEPLPAEDLEDIATIEAKVLAGTYPLLAIPLAIRNVERATRVALERRLDLLTLHDRVDDARRGVAISRNALLPRLDWQGRVSFYTDPNAYSTMQFEFEHSDWFTQITLEVPWERTRERIDLRARLIDVRAAQRAELDQAERIRVDVRRNVNLLRLADISVEIQERAVKVAERQAEYASLQFEEGLISNRDKLEAEDNLLRARAALSLAKTSRWNQLLQFRLVTETLRVDDDGTQHPDPESLQD